KDSIILVDGLMERDWGDLVGKDFESFRQLRNDPKMLATYSFESDEDFSERVRTTFDHIISDATNKHYFSILIFTHGGFLNRLWMHLNLDIQWVENSELVSIRSSLRSNNAHHSSEWQVT
ncbi:MAG: histidine phosphatase family protein, partial [Candidatus Kariarchaeaceae archaeon]